MGEHVRSVIHRIAGVVLIGAGFYHVFYLSIAREGRRLLRDIAPRPKDALMLAPMLYYLGLSKKKPQFGRFTYGEKAEYWALVWGTALMGVTGMMLWAKVWVGNRWRAGGLIWLPRCTSTRRSSQRWRSWCGTSTRCFSISMFIR